MFLLILAFLTANSDLLIAYFPWYSKSLINDQSFDSVRVAQKYYVELYFK